ncbi:protein YIF1A [Galendromus occidentalis]|uniref:Protein YIF1 n=1 Tax=Galendromus occidentalis TaxID=34638 RepID=A0AAJ6QT82_9ACAR|nr:protein YIF1A [Galendromus occidentalis]
MDLRRPTRPGSRQYNRTPTNQSQSPQLFEDTSQAPSGSPVSVPYYPQQSASSGQGWESYDLGLNDYGPQGLPPYDPFGQQQQMQHQQSQQHLPGLHNNAGGPPQYSPTMGTPMGYQNRPGVPPQYFNPQQLMNDPMASMAMQYGQNLAGHGREIVHEKIEKYVSISKLKYYFAVDTSYVSQKLFLLVFPFAHKNWTLSYNQDEPVPPRYDVNAPDLYIPTMAFVSYILLSAYMMGLENRFSPEVLGMQASWSLCIMILETVLIMMALYILNINTYLKLYDLMAFCGYKFVPMILALLVSIPLGYLGYLSAGIYCSLTFGFFLLRTLRVAFLSNPGTGHFGEGSRRSLYLLLGLCFFQPAVIWFMTHSLLLTPALEA